MPVPKRKTSKRRKNQRSSTKFIRAKTFTECSNCNSPISSHQTCVKCGFYKGRKIMKTKLDRALKRGEVKAAAFKKHAEQDHKGEPEGQSHEEHNK